MTKVTKPTVFWIVIGLVSGTAASCGNNAASISDAARLDGAGRGLDAASGADAGLALDRDAGLLPVTANEMAPAWVHNIAVGKWAEVGLNTLADVDPENDSSANPNYPKAAPWHGTTGQAAVVDAWNGGTFATRYGAKGSYILFGGGHANYFGSEVYAFDMATQRWSRLSNPYPGPFNWPYPLCQYPDGSAIPPHTYSFASYDPVSNAFVLIKGQDQLGNVTGFTPQHDIVHFFDLDSRTWRRSGFAPDPKPRLVSGGWCVYDPSRRLFWAEGGNTAAYMAAFAPNTDNGDGTYGTWKGTYSLKTGITDAVAAYDPADDIIVILPWRDRDTVNAVDLANPDAPDIVIHEAGSPPATRSCGSGWRWSRAKGAFIQAYARDDAAVYQLKLTSGTWDTGTWTWSLLTASDNTVIPKASTNPVFDRFQVVTYRDAEIAVVCNDRQGPVYAFRIQ